MEYTKVKQQITEKLAQQTEFSDQDNLLELGLNSLQIMRLVNQWRKQGVKLRFGDLMENPTLGAWWNLMQMGCIKNKIAKHEKRVEAKINEPFPMQDVQYAYWIGRGDNQVLGGIGCHAYLEFDGTGVDPKRLETAWNMLLQHHPMLRARFLEDGTQEIMEKPYQKMFTVHDLSEETNESVNKKLEIIRSRLSHRKLQVEKGEVAGITLSILPDNKTRIHLDIDLLVADVQSLQILLRDLAQAYTGGMLPDESKNWSFQAYMKEQAKALSEEKEADKLYWRKRLESLPSGPLLPLKKRPEEITETKFSRRIIKLSNEEWDGLKRKAAAYQSTPAMLLLTAYATVLERWSTNKKFLINIPLFNRNTEYAGLESVIADFTTLLLLEADCEHATSFLKLLKRIQAQVHQDMKHASYSGVQVQRDLSQQRGGQQIVAPVVFACNLGTTLINETFETHLGKFTYMISQTPQVWLDFQTYEEKDGLMLTWDSVDELFPENMLNQMFQSFECLLHQLAKREWTQEFDVLPKKQKEFIAENKKIAPIAHPKCLHEAFLSNAEKYPDAIALVDTGRNITFTYHQLERKVLSVAAGLIEQEIRNQPIAITLPRSYEQIEAVLAILVSGNFYVPVSCNQPKERRDLIHKKTDIQYVLTSRAVIKEQEFPSDVKIMLLDELEKTNVLDRYPEVSPEESAYIIMTSGSTGQPKGVEIAHFSAWNTIETIRDQYGISRKDVALAVSALDFDLSVFDIFGILGAGGKLVLIPEEEKRNACYWLEQVQKQQVTVWNSVPVLLDMLLVGAETEGAVLPFHTVMLSGDWIPLDLPERLYSITKDCVLVAMGGATEASIWSNFYNVTLPIPREWKSIPYGQPLRGQAYRVVDQQGRDCPAWVEGELWIGGHGVAKGYRGDLFLTERKFVKEGSTIWYRTGDNGRFWENGIIEFLGRQDNQVKIRGHRIELGEIQQAMISYDGVKNAIADSVGERKGDKYLIAFAQASLKEQSGCTMKKTCSEESKAAWKELENKNTFEVKAIREDYKAFTRYANKKALWFMGKALNDCGLFLEKESYSFEELVQKGCVCREQETLLRRWLTILVENQWLQKKEKVYEKNERYFETDLKGDSTYEKKEVEQYFEKLLPYGKALLTGTEEPIYVFYQEGMNLSPNTLLEQIPGQEESKEIFVETVKTWSIKMNTDKPLEILEWDGRDIQVTLQILTMFEKLNIVYSYTIADHSRFFLDIAKEKLKEYEQITYTLIGTEMKRGREHSYDCILAWNSLHRAQNIEHVLQETDDYLTAGGILCMQELTEYSYLEEITASFLEKGFSQITDVRKEKEQVLLTAKDWKKALENQFESVLQEQDFYGRCTLVARQKKETYCYCQEKLKNWLSGRLPEYMIPKNIYFMEQFPVTSNGKIDRKVLKACCQSEQVLEKKDEVVTETEQRLLTIWRTLFQNENIGVEDNYFLLGGDSLVATRLIAKIRKEFQRKISIAAIFERTTVKELAKVIDCAKDELQERELVKIEPHPEQIDIPFPLTDVQYAYWIGRRGLYALGKVSTHCYFELDTEALDIKNVQNAWNVLIKKHGMMRVIVLESGEQKILKEVPAYQIPVTDCSNLTETEKETVLKRKREEMSHQVIDTNQWPLFDVELTVIDSSHNRLHISFDNLILDGWSMFHILRQWADIYYNGQERDDTELSFRDYVLGLERIKHLPLYEQDKKYWMERIETLSPAPELPLAKKEEELVEQRFHRRSHILSKEDWIKLKKLAEENDITASVLLMTAFGEVLRKYSGNPNITINLTQFDRKPLHKDVDKLVGDFTTLTLLEMKDLKKCTFNERARAVQKQLMEDLEHSSYSAIEVEREMRKQAGVVQNAIMPIVFTSGLGIDQWDEGKWLGKLVYNISQTPQVWLDHQVVEKDGGLCLFWDSVDELFYPGMLDDMFAVYTELLESLAKNPKRMDEHAPSLVKAKISHSRQNANATQKEMKLETLDYAFLEAVKKYPEKEAVVTSNRRMTYREVKEEAFYISQKLQEENVKKQETVAIMIDKGWEQIVSVYGVLFAGGVYLPIDVRNPRERIEKILESSSTNVILVTQDTLEQHPWIKSKNYILVNKKRSIDITLVSHSVEDLAYVIYTSGTTGIPKGVMITHKGAMNTIQDINDRYHVTSKDKVLGLSSLHFDLSVYDIFGLLSVGGTLVLPDSTSIKEPAHWVELLNQEKITIWNSVPAFVEMLAEYELHHQKLSSKSIETVMMSGDWIPLNLPEKIRSIFPDCAVVSMGGATEASIWSNVFDVPKNLPKEWVSIPYGKPLSNQQYYILDSGLQDCPDWVPGMLYIGGAGVAQGYFHDEALTKERFIKHPVTGEKLYNTGDMARYWPDGNIEFLGRMDNQVKLSGYRVEIGEVESALLKIEGIQDVLVMKHPYQHALVAFLVKEQGKESHKQTYYQEILKGSIPEYMIPSLYIEVDDIPLSGNGKKDKKQLEPVLMSHIEEENKAQTEPLSEMQEQLVHIWGEILGLPSIKITSNFFEIGGNSIQAISLTNRLTDEFEKEVGISELFEYPTIQALEKYLKG